MTNLEEEKEVQVNSQVRESRTPTREDYETLNKVEEEVFKQRKHMFTLRTSRALGDVIEAHGGEQPYINQLGAAGVRGFLTYAAGVSRGKFAREIDTALEKDKEKKQALIAFQAVNRPARQESKYTEEEIQQKMDEFNEGKKSSKWNALRASAYENSLRSEKVTRYLTDEERLQSHKDSMGNVFKPEQYWSMFEFKSQDEAVERAAEILREGLAPGETLDTNDVWDYADKLIEEDYKRAMAMQNEAAREQYIKLAIRAGIISKEPEWAEKAMLLSMIEGHGVIGQAAIDFAQNIPNLLTSFVSVAAGEALAGPFGAVAGHGVSYMALAEQEYSGFLEAVDPFVLDYNLDIDLAYKYAELYGAISGIVEHSEQLLNIASIGGTGKAGAAMAKMFPTEKLYGRVLKWAAGVGINMVSEGFEEVSQQALQHYFTAQMLQEWAKRHKDKFPDKKPPDFEKFLEKSNLPINPVTLKVDWKKARADMLREFQAGAGVAFFSGVIGAGFGRIRAAHNRRSLGRLGRKLNIQTIQYEQASSIEQKVQHLNEIREIERKMTEIKDSLPEFKESQFFNDVAMNLTLADAQELSQVESMSRKQWEEFFRSKSSRKPLRLNEQSRQQYLDMIKAMYMLVRLADSKGPQQLFNQKGTIRETKMPLLWTYFAAIADPKLTPEQSRANIVKQIDNLSVSEKTAAYMKSFIEQQFEAMDKFSTEHEDAAYAKPPPEVRKPKKVVKVKGEVESDIHQYGPEKAETFYFKSQAEQAAKKHKLKNYDIVQKGDGWNIQTYEPITQKDGTPFSTKEHAVDAIDTLKKRNYEPIEVEGGWAIRKVSDERIEAMKEELRPLIESLLQKKGKHPTLSEVVYEKVLDNAVSDTLKKPIEEVSEEQLMKEPPKKPERKLLADPTRLERRFKGFTNKDLRVRLRNAQLIEDSGVKSRKITQEINDIQAELKRRDNLRTPAQKAALQKARKARRRKTTRGRIETYIEQMTESIAPLLSHVLHSPLPRIRAPGTDSKGRHRFQKKGEKPTRASVGYDALNDLPAELKKIVFSKTEWGGADVAIQINLARGFGENSNAKTMDRYSGVDGIENFVDDILQEWDAFLEWNEKTDGGEISIEEAAQREILKEAQEEHANETEALKAKLEGMDMVEFDRAMLQQDEADYLRSIQDEIELITEELLGGGIVDTGTEISVAGETYTITSIDSESGKIQYTSKEGVIFEYEAQPWSTADQSEVSKREDTREEGEADSRPVAGTDKQGSTAETSAAVEPEVITKKDGTPFATRAAALRAITGKPRSQYNIVERDGGFVVEKVTEIAPIEVEAETASVEDAPIHIDESPAQAPKLFTPGENVTVKIGEDTYIGQVKPGTYNSRKQTYDIRVTKKNGQQIDVEGKQFIDMKAVSVDDIMSNENIVLKPSAEEAQQIAQEKLRQQDLEEEQRTRDRLSKIHSRIGSLEALIRKRQAQIARAEEMNVAVTKERQSLKALEEKAKKLKSEEARILKERFTENDEYIPARDKTAEELRSIKQESVRRRNTLDEQNVKERLKMLDSRIKILDEKVAEHKKAIAEAEEHNVGVTQERRALRALESELKDYQRERSNIVGERFSSEGEFVPIQNDTVAEDVSEPVDPKKEVGAEFRKIESTGEVVHEKPMSRQSVLDLARKLFPEVAFRGRATDRMSKDTLGFYQGLYNLIRSKKRFDLNAIAHEIGHHVERLSKVLSMEMPADVQVQLEQMGRALYGNKKPAISYESEGWAQFIAGWMADSEEMTRRMPDTTTWFNTEFAQAHPEIMWKMIELRDAYHDLQEQSPEGAVRAFHNSVTAPGALPSFVRWARKNFSYIGMFDDGYFLLRDMRRAGLDIDVHAKVDSKGRKLSSEERAQRILNHPHLLLTHFRNKAGRITSNLALENTTDLLGVTEKKNRIRDYETGAEKGAPTSESLRQALSKVSVNKEILESFKDFAVAMQAREYHRKGLESGLSKAEVERTIAKLDSPTFRDALERMTAWSRRIMHLLVDAGWMTQQEFDAIEADNSIYVKFSRAFTAEDYNQAGARKGGEFKIHKRKGGEQHIYNPINAMLVDAQQIVEVAQATSVARAMVHVMETAKIGDSVAKNWLVPVDPPVKATEVPAEYIKNAFVKILIKRGELSPDAQQEIQKALELPWSEKLKFFTSSQFFNGKERIVPLIINGQRKFFEVGSQEAFDALSRLVRNKRSRNALMRISKTATDWVRFGATTVNPRFGLLTNPLKDTLTASVFSSYGMHIPAITTLHGIAMDLLNTDTARIYRAMGLDLDTLSGQNLIESQKLGDQVTAATRFQMKLKRGIIHVVSELLSIPEIGTRLPEFRGAMNYWTKQLGTSPDAVKAAKLMAALAAGDVTVFFSRHGTWTRDASNVIVFFNAGMQCIDKLLRSLGAIEAMPWEKHQSRRARAIRTLMKAGLHLTSHSLLSYFLNRDKDWWKELPPHEKWGYLNYRKDLKIPLPFELGLIFGSLLISILEEQRNPGALQEWAGVAADALPMDVSSLHGLFRNVTAIAPFIDIVANKNWRGAPLISENTKRNFLPYDWATERTSEFARFLGRIIWEGVKDTAFEEWAAPVYIDHVLNEFGGSVYRMTLGFGEKMKDPSVFTASGDKSQIPLLGVLFRNPANSSVVRKLTERTRSLEQMYGSGELGLTEYGEMRKNQALERELNPMWRARRDIWYRKDLSAGEKRKQMIEQSESIFEKVREYNKKGHDYREAGFTSALNILTAPNSRSEQYFRVAEIFTKEGIDVYELNQALLKMVKRKGKSSKSPEYLEKSKRIIKRMKEYEDSLLND
jgi:hypothetical protein